MYFLRGLILEILPLIPPILFVIGAIAGWRAGLTVRGYGFGLIGNIAVGIFGAVIFVSYMMLRSTSNLTLLFRAICDPYGAVIFSSGLIGPLAGWLAGVIMKHPDHRMCTPHGVKGPDRSIGMGTIAGMIASGMVVGWVFFMLSEGLGDGFFDIACGAIAAWLVGLLMHGADYRLTVGIIGAAITIPLVPLLERYGYTRPGFEMVSVMPIGGGWFLLLVGGLAQLVKLAHKSFRARSA